VCASCREVGGHSCERVIGGWHPWAPVRIAPSGETAVLEAGGAPRHRVDLRWSVYAKERRLRIPSWANVWVSNPPFVWTRTQPWDSDAGGARRRRGRVVCCPPPKKKPTVLDFGFKQFKPPPPGSLIPQPPTTCWGQVNKWQDGRAPPPPELLNTRCEFQRTVRCTESCCAPKGGKAWRLWWGGGLRNFCGKSRDFGSRIGKFGVQEKIDGLAEWIETKRGG